MTAPDLDAIEASGKRWHGEDHRIVQVRWEPYKPDGQRQMKAKGRWQEQVGSGDFWRWQNCERPAGLTSPIPLAEALVLKEAATAREVFEDYGSKAKEAIDYMEQLLLAALRAIGEGKA